nr:MAG TPA: hypothetical protein [Podoviridae sp. ctY3D12]
MRIILIEVYSSNSKHLTFISDECLIRVSKVHLLS